MLGLVYLDENNFEEATRYLDLGEQLMPPFIREGRNRFYNDKAKTIAAVTPGLNDGAQPVIYGPHFLIAKRLQDIGEWDKALEHYQLDLKVYPGNLATYVNIGNCYFFLQKPEQALQWYRQAIDHHPGYAEAWLQAALAERKMHRDAEAQQDFERARALDPKLSEHFPGQVAAYSSDIPVK
jgi:tetratricopeptide (TPR) repeat protein